VNIPKCRICGEYHWGVCNLERADPALTLNKYRDVVDVDETDFVNISEDNGD